MPLHGELTDQTDIRRSVRTPQCPGLSAAACDRRQIMKRWICFLLAFFLVFQAAAPVTAQAAAGGELSVNGNNITVTLQKPRGVTEAVTSLRFWMYVSVTEGEMEAPVFRFADTAADGGVSGVVKDAAVTRQGNRFVIDLILAGKRGQDIFRGGASAVIGTLTMTPASQNVRAEAGVAGEEAAEGAQPVLKYISGNVLSEQAVFLQDVKPVMYSGSVSDLPVTPPAGSFQKNLAPKLKLGVKNTTRKVNFSWKQIPGADGYKIYQYQEDTGKYKRIKTISGGDQVTYSRKTEYGACGKYRMRAFQTQPDGTKVYGAYSAAKEVTAAPAKVRGLSYQKQGYAKTLLTWNQTVPADGYQVFRGSRKNGSYTRLKTIKKGDVCRYVIKNQPAGKAFYKVRAFVLKADGSRKYGAFSGAKAVIR